MTQAADFGFGTQIRKSPYFDATVRWGAQGFSAYNHMRTLQRNPPSPPQPCSRPETPKRSQRLAEWDAEGGPIEEEDVAAMAERYGF